MAEVRRRRPEPEIDRGPTALAVIFLATATGLLAREAWTPRVAEGLLVEVTGDVAAPGLYVVDPPTLAAAVEAAGGISEGVPETPLVSGDAVAVAGGAAQVVRASQPLLAGLPVDVAVDGVDALAAVPGLGAELAAGIVADRGAAGPVRRVDELDRVRGLGERRLAQVAPYLTVEAPRPVSRVDVNRADADALATLPGVGPSLAARIVADRAAHGPYGSVDALDRVSGIGPATVARLRDLAEAAP